MLGTMTQGESGTGAKSSGLTGPQMNSTSPSGAHSCAAAGSGAPNSRMKADAAPMAVSLLMMHLVSSPDDYGTGDSCAGVSEAGRTQ